MKLRYRIGTALLALFLIICSGGGFHEARAAQQKIWKPTRPMTIIVHSYGSTYDWIARHIARILPDYLGQKVIVQGVTGGAGGNALDTVYRSKPDGYTMNLTPLGTYLSLAAVKSPYPWKVQDIPTILAIDTDSYVVCSGAKSPFTSYEDIIKMKKVVRVALGSASFTVIPLLEDFDKKGVQYKVARFKGLNDAVLAVIAGNADIYSSPLSGFTLDKMRAGDLRTPLWVFDTKPLTMFPKVPTVIDLGMPKDYASYHNLRLLQVPPGTPDYIQKGLKEGLTKTMKDKRTLEWSKKFETTMDIMPEKEASELMRVLIKGFQEHPKIVEAYF